LRLGLPNYLFPFRFSRWSSVRIFSLPHADYMSSTFKLSRFYHRNISLIVLKAAYRRYSTASFCSLSFPLWLLVIIVQRENIYLWLYSPCGPWSLIQFLNLIHSRSVSLDGGSARRKTHRATQTQNRRTQTLMPKVGFGPTIPVFGQAKTVHASDRAATVM
jgi:hypothetical protein